MSAARWPERLWIVRHGESAGNVARDRAHALGVDRIARWARDLDTRGIRLVPASVALRGAVEKRVSTAN